MAASTTGTVQETMHEGVECIGENETLLEAAKRTHVPRLVYASSSSVYGNAASYPTAEDDLPAPHSPYGVTKLAAEHLCNLYAANWGTQTVSLRYFNAAGADPDGELGEEHDPETHLIPLVLAAAADPARRVAIFGDDYPTPDGTCVRDYVHVSDLAVSHVAAAQRLTAGDELRPVYNLGSGTGCSVAEIMNAIRTVTGIDFTPHIGPRRPGDPARIVATGFP